MDLILFLVVVTAAMLIIIGGVEVARALSRPALDKNKSPYVRKGNLLDVSEVSFLENVAEICGDKYFVFPQVHLGRLLDIKTSIEKKNRPYFRSRVDRKPADFAVCNKEGAILALIDVGGGGDNFPDSATRNKFVEDLSRVEGLPLVKLKTSMGKEAIRAELQKVLPNL